MKRVYLAIIALVVAGFAISYYLIPTEKELDLMRTQSLALPERTAEYESKIAQGDLSYGTVRSLSDLYIKAGKLPETISLWEKYVDANPQDKRGYEKLGELYQMAGRTQDYANNLAKLNELQSSAENLRKLSDLYNSTKEYDKQEKALAELIKLEPENTKNYIDRAQILILLGRNDEAGQVIEELRQKNPDAMTYETVEILVNLYTKTNRTEEAYQAADAWLAQHPDLKHTAVLGNYLHAGGRPDLTLKLIEPVKAQVEQEPELLYTYIQAQLATDQEKQAYEYLKALHAKNALPENMRPLLLDVAMRYRDYDLVQNIVDSSELTKLPEPTLMNVIEFADITGKTSILRSVGTRLTDEYFAANPGVKAQLAVVTKDPDAMKTVQSARKTGTLKPFQQVKIGKACGRRGHKECAQQFLDDISPYSAVDDALLVDLAGLFIIANREDRGLPVYEEMRQTRKSLNVQYGWAMLAAANGRAEDVSKWLDGASEKELNNQILLDLYFIADQRDYHKLSRNVIERLYKRNPSDENEYYLANALVNNGQVDEALKHLRALRGRNYPVGSLYQDVLYQAALDNAKYRPELKEALLAELRSKEITAKRKQEVIQMLVDIGEADEVLPDIRKLAETQRGNWVFLYEETLQKKGRVKELEEFRKQFAASPKSGAKDKRRLAYTLLNDGNAKEAEDIFVELADQAKPDSDDVKQLMYLWGPRPEASELQWIADRAGDAPIGEREKWIDILLKTGGERQAMKVIEATPSAQRTPTMRAQYIAALKRAPEGKELLGRALQSEVASMQNPAQLKELAKTAYDFGLYPTAAQAYQKLLAQQPNDLDALKYSGLIAYQAKDYKTASAYFDRYFQLGGRDYEPMVAQADILTQIKNYDGARAFYQNAVADLERRNNRDLQANLMLAQAYSRLGRPQDARNILAPLVVKYPQDANLRADYLQLLVDTKNYKEAEDFVRWVGTQQAPQAPNAQGQYTELPREGVRAFRTTTRRDELVLEYYKPVEKLPTTQAFLAKKPEWISAASTGYNSVLLVTEPSNEFVFDTKSTDRVRFGVKPVSTAAADQQKAAYVRFDLLAAKLDQELGRDDAAKAKLERAAAADPSNPYVLTALAGSELKEGRRSRALELLDRAGAAAPNNSDIANLREQVQGDKRSMVRADTYWQQRDDNTEIISTFTGRTNVTPSVEMGVVAENNYVDYENLQRARGNLETASGSKQRGEVYARKEFDSGIAAKVSGFTNNDTVGGGAYLSANSSLGETTLLGEYKRPNWDFVEGVMDDATRDRVGLVQTITQFPDITMYFLAAYNNYSVYLKDDVTQSVSALAHIRVPVHVINPAWNIPLSIGYTFDAEYRTDEPDIDLGSAGIYPLYPLLSREVHFLDLLYQHQFGNQAYGDLWGGYAYDRLGGNGPAVGARFWKDFDNGMQAGVSAQHNMAFNQSGSDITRAGGYLQWKFSPSLYETLDNLTD